MQYKKEKIKNLILNTAKDEFLEKGFKNTSIRSIATKCEIRPSNIYIYYKNKDELLIKCIGPLINQIELAKKTLIDNHEKSHFENFEENLNMHYNIIEFISKFIEENKKLLNLILFNSYGSSLEKYVDSLIDWITDYWYNQTIDIYHVKLDKFFIHNMASIFHNFIRESLMHNISSNEFKENFHDLMTMILIGFEGLMKQKAIKKLT